MIFVGAIEAFDYSGAGGNKRNALSAFHPALPIYCTLRATYKGPAVYRAECVALAPFRNGGRVKSGMKCNELCDHARVGIANLLD